ncbi:ABC transporter ATP-binding protein [Actinobacteria bacterium YIM 96077]|uniref:ABC transporter ATP-binding protein n=1 Tax=Phytoactinopolyspora halophila TaxID=1981511 RepID=A0A329QTH6_9ACTN|nr:ABC transporter ATP-binding protein [Phytoactinopolyspora halophila]AYY14326.1 ABC transporter ATP-binding protein [Actinobacteria bacterium YIM 96077]RAW14869.1 ABC transporter ATP-binding protein [Phytoactinopolyspora halophila]
MTSPTNPVQHSLPSVTSRPGGTSAPLGADETYVASSISHLEPPSEEEVLRVEDLTVGFPTDDGLVKAVRGVSYAVHEREVLGIVGESGSGKSVSSMAIMGLLPKNARITGKIFYRGDDVLQMSARAQRSLRGRKIGMIFQDPMTALNPVYTIGDQLAEAVLSHEIMPRKKALARAEEMLALVGIPQPRRRLDSYPHEFSGGMRQRAMIAMAVINYPDVIIADEPTTALDVTVQAQILEKLLEVKDEVSSAIILITHDLGVVAGNVHRVLVMYAGKPVEIGEVDEVFYRPRMPYTAGLLGSIPALETATGERLRPIQGTPPSLINMPPGCPFSPRCPLTTAVCRQDEPELVATDGMAHLAACHHWNRLAEQDDPTTFFRAESEVQDR